MPVNRPMAWLTTRPRDASTSRRTFGSFAQENAVRLDTPFYFAHAAIDPPPAIARARSIFLMAADFFYHGALHVISNWEGGGIRLP